VNIDLNCIGCLVRQAIEAGRFLGLPEAARHTLVRSTLQHLATCSWDVTAPEIAAATQALLQKLSGQADPYRPIKQASTKLALEGLPSWQAAISQALNPLEFALRLAAAGNLIDCGPTGHLDVAQVMEKMQATLEYPLSFETVADFRECLTCTDSLLLIADNAGELVTDRLLLETLESIRPGLEVTVMVRGDPVLNDATRADAAESGLPAHWRLVDTKTAIPGLVLARSPKSVQKLFAQAGLILSKGQGNWEALEGMTDPRLFFLLTCKCPFIATALGETPGRTVLRRASDSPGNEGLVK
jgi:hypothetical protein